MTRDMVESAGGQADRSITRRRFIATSGAIGAGAVFAGLGAWPAVGDPAPDCGSDNDDVSLWKDVKDKTPQNFKPNVKVEYPLNPPHPKPSDGYAVHTGGDPYGPWDWLVLPLNRVTGIECKKCWLPGEMLNLWPYAAQWANDPASKLAGDDWILAINSGNKHTSLQLHIHVTRFDQHARDAITKAVAKKAVPATSANDWPNHTIVIGDRLYRWLQLSSIDHRLFADVRNYVAKSDAAMVDQIIAVVQVDPKNPKSGYYVLNSEKALSTHSPFGANDVENLLYRKHT